MTQEIGDCYQAAVRAMWDLVCDGTVKFAALVHGTVKADSGDIIGERYGHAWVEIGGVVFDRSNGRDLAVPREEYYRRGEVVADECSRYNLKEMSEEMLRTEHYGPWDRPLQKKGGTPCT